MRILLIGSLLALTTACTQFPELDAQLSPETEAADYPALVPLDGLLAQRTLPQDRGTQILDTVEARAAALKSRANRLRRGVLTPAERARLRQRPGA